jgi:hypothetical protein
MLSLNFPENELHVARAKFVVFGTMNDYFAKKRMNYKPNNYPARKQEHTYTPEIDIRLACRVVGWRGSGCVRTAPGRRPCRQRRRWAQNREGILCAQTATAKLSVRDWPTGEHTVSGALTVCCILGPGHHHR